MDDYYGRLRDYYERRAAEYDDAYRGAGAYSGLDWPGFEWELAEAIALVEVLPPATVLDVGCGTGFITRHLRGEITGLDQSAGMLEIARERAPWATFVRGDALDLPFPDGSFGRAFLGNVCGVLLPPERERLLEEAGRVASEIVVFETSGALTGASEQWQERALSDGSLQSVYRRYFAAADLLAELGGGRTLFDGEHFVLVSKEGEDRWRPSRVAGSAARSWNSARAR